MAASSGRSLRQAGLFRPARRRMKGRSRAARVVLYAGLTVLLSAALPGTADSAATTRTGQNLGTVNVLSPLALGLNTAPWDYIYAAGTSARPTPCRSCAP
jgi:hypothetical protein